MKHHWFLILALAWMLWQQKDYYSGTRGEYNPMESYSTKAECEKVRQAVEKKLNSKKNPDWVYYFYCFPSDFEPREQKGNWILWERSSDNDTGELSAYATRDSAPTRGKCEDLRYEAMQIFKDWLKAGAKPKWLSNFYCFPSEFNPRKQ